MKSWPSRRPRATFLHEGAEGYISMMKQAAIVLELYQLPEPELNCVKKRSNGHIDHIAFDIEETYAVLKMAGFNIVQP